jgi:hypothetical protein
MRIIDRWRIARCREEGRELPAGLARRVRGSAALSEYCSGLKRVERSLRESAAPREIAPPGLADGVLERIAAEGMREGVGSRWRGVAGLVLATAACALVGGAAMVMMRPAPPARPAEVPRALAGLRASAALARTPVEEPLVREARLLAQETRRAADVVLASFPSARPGR